MWCGEGQVEELGVTGYGGAAGSRSAAFRRSWRARAWTWGLAIQAALDHRGRRVVAD